MDHPFESLDFVREFYPDSKLPEKISFRKSPYYGSEILAEIASHAKLAIRLTGRQEQVDYSAVKYLGKLLQDFSKPDSEGNYFSDSINEAVPLWEIMKRHYKNAPLMIDSIKKTDGLARALDEVSSRLLNIEQANPEELEGLALICSRISAFARDAADSGRVKRIA